MYTGVCWLLLLGELCSLLSSSGWSLTGLVIGLPVWFCFSLVGLVAALWQTGGLVFGHHSVLWEVTDKVAYRAAACWVGPLFGNTPAWR